MTFRFSSGSLFEEDRGQGSDREAHRRFSVQVHAYCLMGNYSHLLLHTPEGNFSRVMWHINGVYTQRFNCLQKRGGPLFRGRYKAIVVETDSFRSLLPVYPPQPGGNAQVFGCSPTEIRARSRPGRKGYGPARSVAMWLCQDRAGLTLPQIARLFGGIHYSAVSRAVRRIKTRMAEDEELQSLVDRVSRGVIVRCNA